MAWPDTPTLLDNFDRASLGAGWTTGSWYGDSALSIASSTLLQAASGWGGGFYNAATYGPDCDLIVDVPTASGIITLFVRIQDTSNTPDGYKIVFNYGSSCYVASVNNGNDTQIGATFTADVASGDRIGVEIIDNVISIYVYHSGAWSLIASRTDTDNDWPGAGYFAVEIESSSDRVDNLSGGTITAGGGRTTKNTDALALGIQAGISRRVNT